MIIWLASYPRTGSGLMRAVLRHCFGRGSYNLHGTTEAGAGLSQRPGDVAALVEGLKGDLKLPLPWPEFYKQATDSSEVYLVKTHNPPVDDQPALYMLRDGRAAICSYWHFHCLLNPHARRTMADLIVWRDYLGDWSSHWHAWQGRPFGARTLVLRYEELIEADAALLARLAEFCGWNRPPVPWQNPFALIHAAAPEVHRRRSSQWNAPEEWTPLSDHVFAWVHGPLMVQHGDWSEAELHAARSRLATSPDDEAFLSGLPVYYARLVDAKLI